MSKTTNRDSRDKLDLEAVRRLVDLRKIVGADLGQPLRNGRWACPFHNGEGPNFSVSDQHFTCWTCGESGDVLDYLMKRDGLTLMEAAAKIDPSIDLRSSSSRSSSSSHSRPASQPTPPPRLSQEPATPTTSADWQAAIDVLVSMAESALWSSEGREALAWLRARGLDDTTIKRFRLGFLPLAYSSNPVASLGQDDRGYPRKIYADRGITLPWVAPDSYYSVLSDEDDVPTTRWVGCNIRRLPDGSVNDRLPTGVDKYRAVRGSQRGHGYPWPESSMVGEMAFITEGEFDSLIAWQEVGWICNTVTFGSASQGKLPNDARAFLSACPDLVLAFDNDAAGNQASANWLERYPGRARRLYLPDECNDLTELHCSGRSVLGWLREEYRRFGWAWPLDRPSPVLDVPLAKSRLPVRDIFPPRPRRMDRWPTSKRQRWVDRAEVLQEQGVSLWDAEFQAYQELMCLIQV